MANETKARKPRATEAGAKAKLDRLAQYCEISIDVMTALMAPGDSAVNPLVSEINSEERLFMTGQTTALRAVLARIKEAK